MDLHDLTAAYALDALDPDEAEAFERHLSQCEECRAQLAELNETAGALAFGAVAPAPPARLRESVLDAAAAERSNVVPLLRRRWVARGLGVAAAAAACVVVGLAVALSQSSHTRYVSASVVLDRNGNATLHVSGLAAAPSGKTYEAWVIPRTGRPRPVGLFPGGAATTVNISGTLPQNAVVAVTIERAGGARAPTASPIFSMRT
ncbi:MAG TPA: anti-sigma factor [Gaiellaceae bacterium]|nr:anti-sigma factor [Gaiellaceae bacterium]